VSSFRNRASEQEDTTMNPPIEKVALTIPQAVHASGIGRTKLYEYIKRRLLTTRKAGKRTLILRADLEQFLSNLPASNMGGRK
jgi:hypothetical protein